MRKRLQLPPHLYAPQGWPLHRLGTARGALTLQPGSGAGGGRGGEPTHSPHTEQAPLPLVGAALHATAACHRHLCCRQDRLQVAVSVNHSSLCRATRPRSCGLTLRQPPLLCIVAPDPCAWLLSRHCDTAITTEQQVLHRHEHAELTSMKQLTCLQAGGPKNVTSGCAGCRR